MKNSPFTIYRSIFINAKKWALENRAEFIILVTILLLGAFFRLFRISEYMTFLGDEGRDVIVVRRLLIDYDPILIGPGTSIGNMYLGPIYYYMMAPFLLLFNFSPVGPAVMVALLGVATIFFVWYATHNWFTIENGKGTSLHISAIVAAGLYAIAPTVITYSRSSWNPNIMPFFSLFTIFSIWKFWYEEKYKWIVVTMLSMAFVLQSHYMGLLLVPVIGFFWLISAIRLRVSSDGFFGFLHSQLKSRNGETREQKNFLKYSLLASGLFLLLMSPLVIFDYRHGWMNFKAMETFFTQRQTTVSARPWTAFPKVPKLTEEMVTRLVAGTSEFAGRMATKVLVILTASSFTVSFLKSRGKIDSTAGRRLGAYLLIFVWLAVGLVGFGVYKQHIYDHYYGFFFTAPFILIGGIIEEFLALGRKNINFLMFFIIAVFVYFLTSVNLHHNPLRFPPNRQLQRAENVAMRIVEFSDEGPFNFAIIAERNYESGYRYFFESWGSPSPEIIADKPETITDQLFVVCELPRERCDPEGSDRYELSAFGWRKIVAEWNVEGVTIFKLIHEK